MSDDDPGSRIRRAHALDGSKEANNDLYRDWAASYDADTSESGFVGPLVCALLVRQAATTPAPRVLDVGCGTGLLGRELQPLLPGARITGMDLSPEMAEVARQTGCYEHAVGDVDLNEPLPVDDPYDLVVCCGTFAPGHVGPAGLGHLVDATVPGGAVAISVRGVASHEGDFATAVQQLADARGLDVATALRNAPYIDGEGADYWTVRLPG